MVAYEKKSSVLETEYGASQTSMRPASGGGWMIRPTSWGGGIRATTYVPGVKLGQSVGMDDPRRGEKLGQSVGRDPRRPRRMRPHGIRATTLGQTVGAKRHLLPRLSRASCP